MYNFITLFDKNYLSRGFALYNSLLKNCNNFFLYILAMDYETEDFLNRENYNNISVISLSQIETFYPELIELKKIRSKAEYCWTLTPYSIQYAIKKNNLDSCTYLDSDIYFFNDPKILFDEAGNNSIIITEHKYTLGCDQTKTCGKYCVQFIFFRNDKHGMEALEWWRQRCREWCYSKFEDGKFGDQKYLDDWTTRFTGVYVPAHIGCGLAPWNIQQYNISIENDKLYSQDKVTRKKELLIFYHFHNLMKLYANKNKIIWFLSPGKRYVIDINVRELIYANYVEFLTKFEETNYGSLFTLFFFLIKDIIRNLLIYKSFKNNNEKIKYFSVARIGNKK